MEEEVVECVYIDCNIIYREQSTVSKEVGGHKADPLTDPQAQKVME